MLEQKYIRVLVYNHEKSKNAQKLDIKSKIKQKSNHHRNYVILNIAVKVLEKSLL